MNDSLEAARRHFTDGLAAVQAGDLALAESCFTQALALAPDRPSVLTNLGVVRVRLGRGADALAPLARATTVEPQNLEAWYHLGLAHAQAGQLPAAVDAFDRALALRDTLGDAWLHRGSALRELGHTAEAARSFERAIALGADPALARYYLSSVGGETAPAAPPRHYVEGLFDGYADDFEPHLLRLGYRAHERVVDLALAACPPPWQGVLDLGCGTGLVGRTLRQALGAQAGQITGVDLSARMLEQARSLGGYDALLHADLGEWLRIRQDRRWQVAFAADVFIYVGAIDGVLRDLRAHLVPGGWLAFSVEALPDAEGDFRVQPSLRYAHSEAYLRRVAALHGWRVAALERAPIREDQRQPVPGLYVCLQS